ncbi:MAG: DUF5615 family PIN-like protein [Phycisphaerae bacterium]|nr:DUF5615 family PIN-like protein [Phycisphaerae bacterium]
MRFLIDMPLSPALAQWLIQQGHDAVHAADLGLDTAEDRKIIERGLKDGRVILTADLDYPRLLALSQRAGPGLILFRGGEFGENVIRRRLGEVFQAVPENELPVSIVVVEPARIRRHRLPIEP